MSAGRDRIFKMRETKYNSQFRVYCCLILPLIFVNSHHEAHVALLEYCSILDLQTPKQNIQKRVAEPDEPKLLTKIEVK